MTPSNPMKSKKFPTSIGGVKCRPWGDRGAVMFGTLDPRATASARLDGKWRVSVNCFPILNTLQDARAFHAALGQAIKYAEKMNGRAKR